MRSAACRPTPVSKADEKTASAWFSASAANTPAGSPARAGFTTIETSVISLELPDKPGQLLRLTKVLSDNNINITTC